MPPPKKTVIQKDGILYIVDHPAYTKKTEVIIENTQQQHKQQQHKQQQHTQQQQHKQPNSIISQCYENHKKIGVTYPDSIQSQFCLLE
jgi:hypothetical protein